MTSVRQKILPDIRGARLIPTIQNLDGDIALVDLVWRNFLIIFVKPFHLNPVEIGKSTKLWYILEWPTQKGERCYPKWGITLEKFSTLEEAKEMCAIDESCHKISDYHCDKNKNEEYFLCKTNNFDIMRDQYGCTYAKPGKIVFNINSPLLIWVYNISETKDALNHFVSLYRCLHKR